MTQTPKKPHLGCSPKAFWQTYGQAAFLKQKATAYIYTNQKQKNRSGGIEGYCLQSQTALLRIVHPCFHLGVNVHTQMNLQTYINLLFRDHQQDGPLNLQIPITFKDTKQHLLHIHEGEGKQSKPSMKQGAVPALGQAFPGVWFTTPSPGKFHLWLPVTQITPKLSHSPVQCSVLHSHTEARRQLILPHGIFSRCTNQATQSVVFSYCFFFFHSYRKDSVPRQGTAS